MHLPYLQVGPDSLTGASATLRDTAAYLEERRFDLFLLDWMEVPASHADVAGSVRRFAEFAHDQFQDTVALLAGLSTRLKTVAVDYAQTDEESAREIDDFLTNSQFLPADLRPR